jgi:hypothetical protein
MLKTGIMLLAFSAAAAARGEAQTPAASPSSPSSSNASISVGYEAHRDHVRYEFANPSNFDTPFLVPHKFVQTYVADNQWVVAAARYPFLGDMWQTEVGLTPTRTTFASDLDTFFNPGGDEIVSGTAGDVSMHALRFAQWSEGRLWGVPVRAGYVYRRDVADFHPADRLVTHSNPPSTSQIPISTHETTISQVHEGLIGIWRETAVARWLVIGGLDVSPLTTAQLTTILPEKYPGQDIRFRAKVAALAGRLQVAWQRGKWPVAFTANYGRTWSYRSSSQYSRDALQLGVRVGFQP